MAAKLAGKNVVLVVALVVIIILLLRSRGYVPPTGQPTTVPGTVTPRLQVQPTLPGSGAQNYGRQLPALVQRFPSTPTVQSYGGQMLPIGQLQAACNDNRDNDGDGTRDYLPRTLAVPADPGCSSAADTSESGDNQCDNGRDDDGDTAIDRRDTGCWNVRDNSEQLGAPSCSSDGSCECGRAICNTATRLCEPIRTTGTGCLNPGDVDGDMVVTCRDVQCVQAGAAGTPVHPLCTKMTCGDVAPYAAPDGTLTIGDVQVVLRLATGYGYNCEQSPSHTPDAVGMPSRVLQCYDMQCADGLDNDRDTLLDYPADRGCTLSSRERSGRQCNDGADNDADGVIDYPRDRDCQDDIDDTERPAPPPINACNDAFDNDGDGRTDSADPGCADAENPQTEFSLGIACDDGQDNDNDLTRDYRTAGMQNYAYRDWGCASLMDADERDNRIPAIPCDNGRDDDRDGSADFPNDPQCDDARDQSELPQCSDSLDNDNDGRVDYGSGVANDPDCSSAGDNSERYVPPVQQCEDAVDNDGDSLIDANDPHCRTTPISEYPECSDGMENDGDGLTDLDDPGCHNRPNEDNEHTRDWACDDNADNDGDRLVDYDVRPGVGDPQCVGPTDRREDLAGMQ